MLSRIGRSIVRLWHRYALQECAYQRFLTLLAESPTEWTMLESGAIRSSQGECPIVEVYQRAAKYGHAGTEDRHNVLRAGCQLGLSQYQTLLIIDAADRWSGFQEQMRMRNDILTALAKARTRTNASPEGLLAAECRWASPEQEMVGV